jgi:hypothetical protein
MPTPVVMPTSVMTSDQQREQIFQLAFMMEFNVMSLMLTPEQELQINQLANSL